MTRTISIQPAGHADLAALAEMSQRLIAAEGSSNPMSGEQLRQRFVARKAGGWQIDLLLADGRLAGYALYLLSSDQYDPGQPVVEVRQFYLEPELRGQGLGRAAFRQLVATRFPEGCVVELSALASNPRGHSFWLQLGFEPYCTTFKQTAGRLLEAGQEEPAA